MPPVPYATMAKAKDKCFRFDIRKKIALEANRNGIKPTARRWGCSRNTVRLWKRRYEEEGLEGLKERSHAPQSCPHRTPPEVEKLVRKCRQKSGFGARRLKEQFDLPCSHHAIGRILRQHGLTRKRRKRHQKKNDLREAKRALAAFERVQMDVKYLTDLAHYVPQMELRGLPRFQYTLRDTRTGLLYLTFADQISKTHASAALGYFLNHLRSCGLDTASVTIQTDNGAEFDGQTLYDKDRGFAFTAGLFGASHSAIPPGCPNANADVESSHNLIETEFYDRETFRTPADFLDKAWTYHAFFNLYRKNSYQQWMTPLQRLSQAAPELPATVALLHPVHLDTLLPRQTGRRPSSVSHRLIDETPAYLDIPAHKPPSGGQHQPRHPCSGSRHTLAVARGGW